MQVFRQRATFVSNAYMGNASFSTTYGYYSSLAHPRSAAAVCEMLV